MFGRFTAGLLTGILVAVIIVLAIRNTGDWLPRCAIVQTGHCYSFPGKPAAE